MPVRNEKCITIIVKKKLFRTSTANIIYISYQDYGSTLHLSDGTTHSTPHLLKEFENGFKDVFKEDNDFFRLSRNILINTEHNITGQLTYRKRAITINGVIMQVPRKKVTPLKKLLCG